MSNNTYGKYQDISNFWDWFIQREPFLYFGTENSIDRDRVFEELSTHLKSLDENLVFELSPIQDGAFKELIISADGHKAIFPFIESIIKKAPLHPHWYFKAFRPRITGDDLTIKLDELELSYSDLFFQYTATSDSFGIELFIRNFKHSDEEKTAIFILLDALVGEYDAVMEIDWIYCNYLEESRREFLLPFTQLRSLIDARKQYRTLKLDEHK